MTVGSQRKVCAAGGTDRILCMRRAGSVGTEDGMQADVTFKLSGRIRLLLVRARQDEKGIIPVLPLCWRRFIYDTRK